jgi:hypothetical protein
MTLEHHSAPGASAAFSYQFERAMLWLAQSTSGSMVGIETLDDVAVLTSGGSLILEQDKHSIRENGAPFGNRSKDLWNTLSIWLDAMESGDVISERTVFFLVSNKVLPECLARKISAASDEISADACIKELEDASKQPPVGITDLCRRVLEPKSRGLLNALIIKTTLVSGPDGNSLREDTMARLQIPDWFEEHANSIADELMGWMQRAAMAAWQSGNPAWISRDHFVNQLHATMDRRKRLMTRERSEHLIDVGEEKVGQAKGLPFVKQLHLITEDDSVVDGAIRDFIRCNIEKMRLSTEGNITDEDWIIFESTLLARWRRIFARVQRTQNGAPETNMGWDVFSDTTDEHREKLAGMDTEQIYLTAGSYHRLADQLRVGWHPSWEALMSDRK